jgi:hypothetical protein
VLAAIDDKVATLWERAGVMLARGLPWEAIWHAPLAGLERLERAYLAERVAIATDAAAEYGEGVSHGR